MNAILIIMMSLTATALVLVAMSKSQPKRDKVFRFTSFPKEGKADVFLVTAEDIFRAYKIANEWKTVNELKWQKVEELDYKDHDKVINLISDLSTQEIKVQA